MLSYNTCNNKHEIIYAKAKGQLCYIKKVEFIERWCGYLNLPMGLIKPKLVKPQMLNYQP